MENIHTDVRVLRMKQASAVHLKAGFHDGLLQFIIWYDIHDISYYHKLSSLSKVLIFFVKYLSKQSERKKNKYHTDEILLHNINRHNENSKM